MAGGSLILAVSDALEKVRPKLPYPKLEPAYARTQFDFPIGHPVDGLVYACSEVEPRLYVPLERFHGFMLEAKLEAFHELCAALGAKRTSVTYAEEDGRDVTAKIRASGIRTSMGDAAGDVEGGRHDHSGASLSAVYEYARPKRPPQEHHTLWVRGEPTWTGLQKRRLENRMKSGRAGFNYSDDMGINAEVAAKLGDLGLKLGGQFESMKKVKFEFEIEFWPLPT